MEYKDKTKQIAENIKCKIKCKYKHSKNHIKKHSCAENRAKKTTDATNVTQCAQFTVRVVDSVSLSDSLKSLLRLTTFCHV